MGMTTVRQSVPIKYWLAMVVMHSTTCFVASLVAVSSEATTEDER
jgi:hypothetical protein